MFRLQGFNCLIFLKQPYFDDLITTKNVTLYKKPPMSLPYKRSTPNLAEWHDSTKLKV